MSEKSTKLVAKLHWQKGQQLVGRIKQTKSQQLVDLLKMFAFNAVISKKETTTEFFSVVRIER